MQLPLLYANLEATYDYDAWGNHMAYFLNQYDYTNVDSISETGAINLNLKYKPFYELAKKNPFRYRGYYYDTETELYYLQTRYYDPELGRFISQDSIEYADPETINGLNLYAYCGNNPVMNVDPTGTSLIGFLIGLAIGLLATQVVSNVVGEHFAAGAASTIGGVQTIGVGISLLAFGPVGWVLGGISILSGMASLAFGVAEFQEHFTGNNYIKNAIGVSAYNGLYIATSIVSTAITIGGSIYMNSSAGKIAHEIQSNSKYWSKGTFKTKYGSLKYHWGKHGIGLTPGQYTRVALDFAEFNASSFKYTFNYKFGNASWYFNNMFGVGGYFTSIGKILTFWLD